VVTQDRFPTLRTSDSEPLVELRDRAERQLNAVRALILGLLAFSAVAYSPTLTPALRLVNVSVLIPTLAWTFFQYLRWYHHPRLPAWLSIANPVVDVTAVTLSMLGYGLAQSAGLALKAPIFLAYFAILAARPVTSSTRIAWVVSALTVVEYSVLVMFLLSTGVPTTASPLAAAAGSAVAPLDEGAKVLLLAVAGAASGFATTWHERLAKAYDQAAREQERLAVRLGRAQFESLKQQLQPHFLFNALNAITALIPIDPRGAEKAVHGLGELLRLSLDAGAEHEVRVERELELLGHYVDMQRLRFQERLTVRIHVDPTVKTAIVPNLVLQPLVENAIRHGIQPRAAGGTVDVKAVRDGAILRLTVADDGIGASLDGSYREGIGLGNTRARLRHMYGDRQRLTVSTAPGAGFTVDIELPYRT